MYQSIQLTKTTSSSSTSVSRSPRRRPRILRLCAAAPALVFLFLAAATAFAGSATWNLNPANGEWITAANWTPSTVPNGPNDTATFGVSNTTGIDIDISNGLEVNGITFSANASAFTFTVQSFSSLQHELTISGVGVVNDSGLSQEFVNLYDFNTDTSGVITFTNSATAGDLTVFTNDGIYTATKFFDTSTASNSTLIARGEGFGGAAGTILFEGDSTGGTARVEVFDDGTLDISAHNAPGVTLDSIEGDGTVTLGGNNLTVGSNDHNTTFSGVIQDFGAGGSLTKLGRKRLILANANTYSGGTTIRGGHLFVRNRTGSGTGSGPVQVNAGRLGGGGIIAGPVTVGTASGSGSVAELSPGDKGVKPGTLTLLSTLTFHSHGNLLFDVNSDDAIADQVIANGVTIRNRAKLVITDLGRGVLKNAELYDTGDGAWAATDNLIIARVGHTATLLQNGEVLVAGGNVDSGLRTELYDPASGTWTDTGNLITARSGHTATLLPDGKVLIAGGTTQFGVELRSAELYDPATGVWMATGSLNDVRLFHTATLLLNGKVLVVGGFSASAELYDPATGNWTQTGRPITGGRGLFTATLLLNGKVLVAGGQSNGFLASAELYDPATGTWAATGSLTAARSTHTATLLTDGTVLVAGGFDFSEYFSTAELYDPTSGTWMPTGSLGVARAYHTATLLPNGEVLVAGGDVGISFIEASELYDPVSGSWAATGSLITARSHHTATLLPEGKVLVAGGGGFALPIGTVFTAINNTSATPISGTFSNLPDGSTVTIGGKNCLVSYSGGDGNDLTLSVVP